MEEGCCLLLSRSAAITVSAREKSNHPAAEGMLCRDSGGPHRVVAISLSVVTPAGAPEVPSLRPALHPPGLRVLVLPRGTALRWMCPLYPGSFSSTEALPSMFYHLPSQKKKKKIPLQLVTLQLTPSFSSPFQKNYWFSQSLLPLFLSFLDPFIQLGFAPYHGPETNLAKGHNNTYWAALSRPPPPLSSIWPVDRSLLLEILPPVSPTTHL